MFRISYLTYLLQLCAVLVFEVKAEGDLITHGDILLGGLFPIHDDGIHSSECGPFNSNPGYQYMEAMLYALDTINANPDILPGIKLGSVIADTCNSRRLSSIKTKKFIKIIYVPESTNNSELVSVVGPMLDGNAINVANILRVFDIPEISYGAMSSTFTGKGEYEYFFRTVPSDQFFYTAMIAFLRRMDWKYVAVVFSDRIIVGEDNIYDDWSNNGICVGEIFEISRQTTDARLDEFIEKLISDDSEPKIVILFTSTRESRAMLAAKKRNPRGNDLQFVAGVTWNNRISIVKDYEDIANGTFTFGFQQGSIPSFEKYFHALRYNNYTINNKEWTGEYWQETHQCKLPELEIPTNFTKNCTGNEDNSIYKDFAPVQVVINAVNAIANALDSLQKHVCPNITGICSKMRPISKTSLLEYIQNVTFEDALSHHPTSFTFNQGVNGNYTIYNYRYFNGWYDYVPVGSWSGRQNMRKVTGTLVLNESAIQWARPNVTKSLHVCMPKCRHGKGQRRSRCCWDCLMCDDDEIAINHTCEDCPPGYTPSKNFSSCLKMNVIYINMDTPSAIVLTVLSVLGIITDLVFLVVFLVYRNHPLIKASGREMCCIIFVGIAAIFVTPITSLVKPTKADCAARRFMAGVSFTICYGPLLVKMWRIHGIFKRTNKLKRLSSGGIFSLGPMLGIIFIIIAIHVLYSVSISNVDPTEVVEQFYPEKETLVLECTTNTTVFISIFAYNFVLILGCTLYAFLTRQFPKNFNEAMYIGITLYLTCVVWIVFFANFWYSKYSVSRVYWVSGSSLLIGWITLLGLFAPKFYHVYTKPEVSREMLITWGELPGQKSENRREQPCEECKRRAEALIQHSSTGNGQKELSGSKMNNGISGKDATRSKHINSNISKDSPSSWHQEVDIELTTKNM